MSLIIAYIGKKGCVMASDKRRIGYFGNKEQLNALESELYSGKIKNDDEFKLIISKIEENIFKLKEQIVIK